MRHGWLAFELFPKGEGLEGVQHEFTNQVKDCFTPQRTQRSRRKDFCDFLFQPQIKINTKNNIHLVLIT